MIARYKDWPKYIRLMISGKGAPTLGLWGVLTSIQLGMFVYLLSTSGQSYDIVSLFDRMLRSPNETAAFILVILLIGVIRPVFLAPMGHVLRTGEYVSIKRALCMAWRRSFAIIAASSISMFIVVFTSMLALVLDVKIGLFVEFPVVVALSMVPFLAAGGQGVLSSVGQSLRLSKHHWVMLFAFYTVVYVVGMMVNGLTATETPEMVRMFCALVAFETVFWISSQSLFMTIVGRHDKTDT